ncbi:MAG: hypothetical protein GC154_05880 [bacterium]|nr:hypothetical protein [bacterium]
MFHCRKPVPHSLALGAFFFRIALPLLLCLASAAPRAATFLIQDRWGGIIGLTRTAEGEVRDPAIVRPWMESPDSIQFIDMEADSTGGYQLLKNGMILPMGAAHPIPVDTAPNQTASALAMTPGGLGGWMAVDDYIRQIGRPPQLAYPASLKKGRRIADLEYDPVKSQLWILFEDGGVACAGPRSPESLDGLKLKNDTAVDVEVIGSDVAVLTRKSRVYFVTRKNAALQKNTPELGDGLAIDLEPSPFGAGFYILDVFGVIHACGGAPEIPTEPLTRDAAVDLEWIPADEAPQWFPAGWNTQVAFQPETLLLDPAGPAKYLTLYVDRAENMARFWAEIEFNPKRLRLDPDQVRVGSWWSREISAPQIHKSLDEKKGILTVHGTGASSIFSGANGGGDAAMIAVAPVAGVTSATAEIRVKRFYFEDAALRYPFLLTTETPAVTVKLEPIQPELSLVWLKQASKVDNPGDDSNKRGVFRFDLTARHASRIQTLDFDLSFSRDTLKFLGMTPGAAWNPRAPIQTHFDAPSHANENGKLTSQQIKAAEPGALRDVEASLLTLFFVSTAEGEAWVRFDSIAGRDERDGAIPLDVTRREARFPVEPPAPAYARGSQIR